MCFISRRPLTYCVIIIIINRKELYDYYYTAITLTTGYKCTYSNILYTDVSSHIIHSCSLNLYQVGD